MNSIIKRSKKEEEEEKNLSEPTIDPREFSPIFPLLFIFTLWLDHKIRFSYKYTHKAYTSCECVRGLFFFFFFFYMFVYDPNKQGEEMRKKENSPGGVYSNCYSI